MWVHFLFHLQQEYKVLEARLLASGMLLLPPDNQIHFQIAQAIFLLVVLLISTVTTPLESKNQNFQ